MSCNARAWFEKGPRVWLLEVLSALRCEIGAELLTGRQFVQVRALVVPVIKEKCVQLIRLIATWWKHLHGRQTLQLQLYWRDAEQNKSHDSILNPKLFSEGKLVSSWQTDESIRGVWKRLNVSSHNMQEIPRLLLDSIAFHRCHNPLFSLSPVADIIDYDSRKTFTRYKQHQLRQTQKP